MNIETVNFAYPSHKKRKKETVNFSAAKIGGFIQGFVLFVLFWVGYLGWIFFLHFSQSLVNFLLNSSEDHLTKNKVKF